MSIVCESCQALCTVTTVLLHKTRQLRVGADERAVFAETAAVMNEQAALRACYAALFVKNAVALGEFSAALLQHREALLNEAVQRRWLEGVLELTRQRNAVVAPGIQPCALAHTDTSVAHLSEALRRYTGVSDFARALCSAALEPEQDMDVCADDAPPPPPPPRVIDLEEDEDDDAQANKVALDTLSEEARKQLVAERLRQEFAADGSSVEGWAATATVIKRHLHTVKLAADDTACRRAVKRALNVEPFESMSGFAINARKRIRGRRASFRSQLESKYTL